MSFWDLYWVHYNDGNDVVAVAVVAVVVDVDDDDGDDDGDDDDDDGDVMMKLSDADGVILTVARRHLRTGAPMSFGARRHQRSVIRPVPRCTDTRGPP